MGWVAYGEEENREVKGRQNLFYLVDSFLQRIYFFAISLYHRIPIDNLVTNVKLNLSLFSKFLWSKSHYKLNGYTCILYSSVLVYFWGLKGAAYNLFLPIETVSNSFENLLNSWLDKIIYHCLNPFWAAWPYYRREITLLFNSVFKRKGA